jgi:hypothetical protein
LRDSFLRLFFISSPFEILIQGRHIPNGINFVEVSYLKIDARVNWGDVEWAAGGTALEGRPYR